MNDIALRIEQLIKRLEMSNAEFARRIGVTRSSVSLWISGQNIPSETTLREICRQFNVDYNWLKVVRTADFSGSYTGRQS